MKKSTVDIPYEGIAGPSENTISNYEKYCIQLGQIQNPVKKTTIYSIDKYNIEIFPDLICAVHLDTSRQFVDSAFGQPLVVRIHGAWIFLEYKCNI